jgi:hypothetical protein
VVRAARPEPAGPISSTLLAAAILIAVLVFGAAVLGVLIPPYGAFLTGLALLHVPTHWQWPAAFVLFTLSAGLSPAALSRLWWVTTRRDFGGAPVLACTALIACAVLWLARLR